MSSVSNTGPRRAVGWNEPFGDSGAIGSPPGFVTGPGTPYPLPSMPVAQAARYWWSRKTWNMAFNITQIPDGLPPFGTTVSCTTGNVPYATGTDSSGHLLERQFCQSGDRTLAPSILDRFAPTQIVSYANSIDVGPGDPITMTCNGPTNIFSDTSGNDPDHPLYVGFGGRILASGSSLLQSAPGFVLDPTTPGNVYMSFVGWGLLDALSTLIPTGITSMLPAGISITFDGMVVPFYAYPYVAGTPPTPDTYTGSATLTTSD